MKVTMEIEIEYERCLWHRNDKEGYDWFKNDVLMGGDLYLVDMGDVGEDIGKVKVKKLIGWNIS